MEALRDIQELRLVRLLRRDGLERLFVGGPAKDQPRDHGLVQIFTLPARISRAGSDRLMERITSYADVAAGPGSQGEACSALPRILALGQREHGDIFVAVEDLEGRPLDQVLAEHLRWSAVGGLPWLGSLWRLLERLHLQGLASGRVLPRFLLVDPLGTAAMPEPLTVPLLHEIHDDLSFPDPAFLRLHPDPGATPPELFSGEGPSPAGDVFQAGVLTHLVLTGRPVFGTGSVLEVANRVRSARPVCDLSDSHPALAGIVAACLAPAPGDRPSAAELRQALVSVDLAPQPLPEDGTSRYSDCFPPLMQVHEGEGPADLAAPEAPRDPRATIMDKEQALEQIEIMLSRASSQQRQRPRRSLPWLLGLLVLLSAAALFYMLPFGGQSPAPSSRIAPEQGGRTHARSKSSTSVAANARRSWLLDGISEPLRSQLDGLGFPTHGVPVSAHRKGTRCEVITEGTDSLRHRFSFPTCKALERVCTLDPKGHCAPRADGTRAFRVLYGPDGVPLLLQAMGPDDEVLGAIEIE